jgi:hypothetical protein
LEVTADHARSSYGACQDVTALHRFAKARVVTIDQLRANPKVAEGRGKKIHALLKDFLKIYDEKNGVLDRDAQAHEHRWAAT